MNRIIVEGITGTGKTTILNMYNDSTGLKKKILLFYHSFILRQLHLKMKH